MTLFRLSCVAAAAALLVACGGSDDSVRGELIDPPAVVTTLTAAQIDATTAASGLQALSGKAKCDVKVVALNGVVAQMPVAAEVGSGDERDELGSG